MIHITAIAGILLGITVADHAFDTGEHFAGAAWLLASAIWCAVCAVAAEEKPS